MAVATGTQIRPELSAVDYTPFVQAAAQGAQMQAQSIAALGQSVAAGVDQYLKKKEEKQKEKDATTFLTTFINNNPEVAGSLGVPLNLKGEVEDPGIVKAAIKTLGGADKALGLATSLQRFEQEKRMAELQMGRIRREAELDPLRAQLLRTQLETAKSEQARRTREEKDIEAMTKAYGAVPQLVPEIEREIVQGYAAPTPMLDEFMYGKVAQSLRAQKDDGAVISKIGDARISLNKLDKEAQDVFTYRDKINANAISPVFGAGAGVYVPERMAGAYAKKTPTPESLLRFAMKDESGAPMMTKDSSGKKIPILDNASFTNYASSYMSKREPLVRELADLTNRMAVSSIPFRQGIASLPSSSIIQKSAKVVERKVSRNASTDEKLAAFMPAYLKEGGSITPDFVENIRKAFKSEMDVYDIGDGITVVRVGNQALPFDMNKPQTPNASVIKMARADNYQNFLSQLASKADWAQLSPGERQIISEMASAYETGQDEIGNRRSAEQAFNQRRAELMGISTITGGAGTVDDGRPATKTTTKGPQPPPRSNLMVNMPSGSGWSVVPTGPGAGAYVPPQAQAPSNTGRYLSQTPPDVR